MHDMLKKEALADLIKYFRKIELGDMDAFNEMKSKLAGMKKGVEDEEIMTEPEEEAFEGLEEPDLEIPEDGEEEIELTDTQKGIRDFFNNKRPGNSKRSSAMFMEAKVNGKPVVEIASKGRRK